MEQCEHTFLIPIGSKKGHFSSASASSFPQTRLYIFSARFANSLVLVSATNWQRIGADERRRPGGSSLQRRHRSHRLLPGRPERHPAAAQQLQRGRAGDPVLAAAEPRRHGADGRAVRADPPRAQPLLRDHVSEQTRFLFTRFSMFLICDQLRCHLSCVPLLLYRPILSRITRSYFLNCRSFPHQYYTVWKQAYAISSTKLYFEKYKSAARKRARFISAILSCDTCS